MSIDGQLTPADLAKANTAACKGRDPTGDQVVREPSDNTFGRFKLLRRPDGLFVVHDTEQWPPNGPVFRDEAKARAHAKARQEEAKR
jgi:hypothetical protein